MQERDPYVENCKVYSLLAPEAQQALSVHQLTEQSVSASVVIVSAYSRAKHRLENLLCEENFFVAIVNVADVFLPDCRHQKMERPGSLI